MPVTEEHWIGWDPSADFPGLPGCPLDDDAAVRVWFEHWDFTANCFLFWCWKGIGYEHSYATFDILGNLIFPGALEGPGGCGFATIVSEPPRGLPENDDLLKLARRSCAEVAPWLQPPGTVEFGEPLLGKIGLRGPFA